MNETPTSTGPSVQEVDAAVRSVLAARVDRSRKRDGEVFAGRLLSLREAERLAAGLREVRVAPGTVITPLARDHLKSRGIVPRFVSRAEAERAGGVGEWGFAIETRSGVVEAFRRSLLDGFDEWKDLGTAAEDAATWVSAAESRGALVLTEEASITVYRACQVAGVRAASAGDAGAVARAVRALGVNLLVVEPAGKPIALLRQISATLRRSGGPIAPDWIGSNHVRMPR